MEIWELDEDSKWVLSGQGSPGNTQSLDGMLGSSAEYNGCSLMAVLLDISKNKIVKFLLFFFNFSYFYCYFLCFCCFFLLSITSHIKHQTKEHWRWNGKCSFISI